MKSNLLAGIFVASFLFVSCNEVREDNVDGAGEVREIASEDTAVIYKDENLSGGVLETEEEAFKNVNFQAPEVEVPALSAAGVEVRGGEGYWIYTVGEDIMFNLDKAKILPKGEEKLQEIVKTLKKQNTEGMIRVYGFTDSLASEPYNKKLALERAKAVENWLQQNSGLDTARMKLVPVGEHLFEATNKTAWGRQQNRRVEIVVVER